MRQEYSFSKRDALESCARRYFYDYFAGWKTVPFDAARKARVRAAKELTGVHLLAGERLHWFIRQFLTRYPNVPAWVEQFCLRGYDDSVRYSRDPAANAAMLNVEYPPKLLLEFHHGMADAAEQAEQAREKLVRAVGHFKNTPAVRDVWREVATAEPWIEKPIGGLPKVDGYGIRGQIDFAWRKAGQVHIVDWKSGLLEGGHDSLQLFIYALWANKQYGIEPRSIFARRVFLGEGTVEPERRLGTAELRRGEARLVQDVAVMRELESYGKAGTEEAFTPCLKINVCKRCKYQAECPEGRELVRSSRTSSSFALPVVA